MTAADTVFVVRFSLWLETDDNNGDNELVTAIFVFLTTADRRTDGLLVYLYWPSDFGGIRQHEAVVVS